MAWLTIRYLPGFSDDLTSWTTAISPMGRLRQDVDEWPTRRRFTLVSEVVGRDLDVLRQLVAAVDFAHLAASHDALPETWDDMDQVTITVRRDDSVFGRFPGPLLF